MRPIIVLGMTVLAAGSALGQSSPTAPPPPAPAQPPRCDAQCIRASADRAVPACASRIEAEAPGDYDWILRPTGSIFQEADAPERPDSTVVRYRGDSIRFMSPQKEWVRAIYECGFDAATGQVAFVRVRLGVIGKKSAIPQMPAPPPQASRAAPGRTAGTPQANAAPAPSGTPAAAGVNLRLIGEPSEVDVRQIRPGTRPPPAASAGAAGQPPS